MKTISKIILILFIASLHSCQDAIDINQVGLLTPDRAIQDVDDIDANLLGAYAYLDNTSQIQFNGTYTDELGIGNTNGGQNLDELALVLNAGSGKPASLWIGNYVAMAQVNRLIESANIITPEASELARYNNLLAQAYTMRAYLHLELQAYFSTDLTDDNALGVIALNYLPGIEDAIARNTNGEVFTLIESDLNLAESLFSGSGSGVTFFNTDVVNAIRARMYAYRGDYANAEIYATALLAAYPLADTATYPAMFTDTADGEVIFKLERTVGDRFQGQGTSGGGYVGSLYSFVSADVNGALFLEMGRALFNQLNPADVRYGVLVHPTSIIDPSYTTSSDYRNTDVLAINKYAATEGINLMADLKIFRSSEMLFIMAEAKANNATDLSGAAVLIKELRDARFGSAQPLPTYANEQEAFADILAERRIELAFEGHRWVDLKRLGAVANVAIDKDPRDCEITGGCTLAINSYKFTMPIPVNELDLNAALVQNPGY